MSLYKKYRIESARKKNWNYSSPGYYFITICTKDRKHFFGEIKNGNMILNPVGQIVFDEWYKSKTIRPNIYLDEFIIMPNHIHGIIQIHYGIPRHRHHRCHHRRDALQCVSTMTTPMDLLNHYSYVYIQNISYVIRGFKSSCTNRIHTEIGCCEFQWQSRFYDRVIRTEPELYNIRKYIQNNPKKW
jgi:putative transposase